LLSPKLFITLRVLFPDILLFHSLSIIA
jgi:hypothetical protein